MSLLLLALIAWFGIGFAVAWLLGKATDLNGYPAEFVTHRDSKEGTHSPAIPFRHRILGSRGMRHA